MFLYGSILYGDIHLYFWKSNCVVDNDAHVLLKIN